MAEPEKIEKKETTQKDIEKVEEPVVKLEKPKEKQKEKPRRLSEIILHPKPSQLLTLLLQEKQWHTAALARESGQSYVYATELIKVFEKEGLITISPIGRRKWVKLTERGEKIAHLIDDILNLSSPSKPPSEEAAKPQQKTA